MWRSTPNLGPIGSAVSMLIGYKRTDRQTDKQTDKQSIYINKLRIKTNIEEIMLY